MNVPSQETVGLLSSDEGGGSSDERSDSSEDEVTEHLTARSSPPAPDMATARAQVPTISVTPHSPGVLEDSLQQLRRLHVAVQRMRAAPPPLLQTGTNRLSASCPSLSKDGMLEPDCSSPTHTDIYSQSRKGSGESRQWGLWEGRDEGRRSSWAALEPGDRPRQRTNLNGHSASLSSMESEGEVPRPVRHSTHSLNDSDLAKDFEKLTMSLRARPSPDLQQPLAILGARLPLQKSVSTPSIVGPPAPPRTASANHISAGGASDTESEDESSRVAEMCRATGRAGGFTFLPDFLEQTEFEHHSEKRRKRGSLFFRKKKDKSRKSSHSWTPSATARGVCDWCASPLAPHTAISCNNCMSTVHQNVCKDYVGECNKPKPSKSVGKSLSTSSGKAGKRSSMSSQSQSTHSTSQFWNEDKDSDHKHDQSSTMDEASTWECPEAFLTADQLGHEAIELGLASTEADTWAASVPKRLPKEIGERETKRQEHIYELILTEKHHCLTIRLMQKLFVEGMRRHGASPAATCRMFPCLGGLWSLHASLLSRLRARQREAPVVGTVADILLWAFADVRADTKAGLRAAYGEFCSRHRDAVDFFKESCAREPKLNRFIRKCQQNPLLRKKGVPECVLFVAQRLTKYPLLIEPLLKATDDVVEKDSLSRALVGVKEILVDVDNQVAAKEREDRKLEIYHRIDAKSFAFYRGRKFKKSDILQGSRSLKFEGVATLMQGRNKMQNILVVVLSDVLIFLHDNNNKYTFFTPDNKAGVVSLSKLLVREKAGADAKGLYLICSGSAQPEMYELRLPKPKDIPAWISAIRAAVQHCPEEVQESELSVSAEDTQRQLDARHDTIATLTEALRAKDREHAVILEEKMALHMKMIGHNGTNYLLELPNSGSRYAAPGLLFPQYIRLSVPAQDTHALWQDICRMVNDAIETNNSALCSISLNRSTSSAGERHSCAYTSPALPRRADTFAGFDRNRHRAASAPEVSVSVPGGGSEAALKLTHSVYTLACVVWQQLTTIHSLEAQLAAWRSYAPGQPRSHDTQLEELRDAQARLTAERSAWEAARNRDMDAILLERRQLATTRQELAEQQKDVEQQRERLYRRLEMLQKHSGSQEEIASVGTLSPDASVADNSKRKEPKWRTDDFEVEVEDSRGSLVPEAPPHLLSASNESRATAHPVVKQQLPLKLASGKTPQPAVPPPGYTRLHESPTDPPIPHHTRAGSSPAPLSAPPPANNKATRTNTYPKLPDKFRPRSSTERTNKPEEEVIYF